MKNRQEKKSMTTTMKLLGLIAVVALVALGGCGEQTSKSYRDVPAAGEQVGNWLPEWIPAEATDIQLRFQTDTNEMAARWTGTRLPADCPQTAGTPRPELAAGLVPEQVPPMVSRCGDTFAFTDGERTYIWKSAS